jgi:hypothetical protein
MKFRTWLWLAVFTAVVVGWAGPVAAAPAANAAPAGSHSAQWYGFFYQPVHNWHSAQCLTASGITGKNWVQQWPCLAYPYQQWRIVWTDSGWFELVVASTGECLTVDAASQDDNHKVVRNFCNGNYSQQWTMADAPIGGGFVFLVARHSGKCLAILSESLLPGATLVQYACTPYSWVIDPIGGSYWHFD